jgi:copper transport protein
MPRADTDHHRSATSPGRFAAPWLAARAVVRRAGEHHLRRAAARLAVTVLLAVALVPASAGAHAAFADANPQPGARLASSPAEITLGFTEPLDHSLTAARIVGARSGRRIAVALSFGAGSTMMLRPSRPLPRGAYEVLWHTVSIRDGHALEGSFGFGVGTSAVGGAAQLEQSPLAHGGWLRVALRSAWYVALFFFGGGLLCGVILGSPGGRAGWLLAGEGAEMVAPGDRPGEALQRIGARTQAAGWIAVAAGTGVALAETRDAAGSLSWRSIDAYLLSTASGGARAVAVAGVLVAVLLTDRAPRAAVIALLAALAAVAVGGHANSASPRALALASDWAHLVAAVLWAGGIAQIAVTWVPGVRALSDVQRRRVMHEVLDRFGRLALPAFAVVVVAGGANALIELGSVGQLWHTAYGRVLLVKIALVGAIGAASFVHAFWLRPGVAAGGGVPTGVERRHWRLLRSQPALAGLVLGAAALLVAFPLPPRQLLERADAQGPAVVAVALRPPLPGQLAVAEEAGPWIAAAWVRSGTAGSASGTVRLLDYKVQPVPARIEIVGAHTDGCGPGCVTFTVTRAPATLRVRARLGKRHEIARIPIRWQPTSTATAEHILHTAFAATDRLHSFQIAERLDGGFGGPSEITHYRIAGRYDFAIVAHGASRFAEVDLGRRVWTLQPDGSWQEQTSSPQDTRGLMPWWTHRSSVRVLDIRAMHGERIAEIALADIRPLSVSIPFWFRLRIDLTSMRVLAMRMITVGHFMDQHYHAFDAPAQIHPPPTGRRTSAR